MNPAARRRTMTELFGIPTGQLSSVLLAIFTVVALILPYLALGDRVAFKMAARNVPRRKAQTALIVMGLMLATLLFSAAFTTGDTLTNSLRIQALENIGRVNLVVKAEQPEAGGGAPFGPGAGGPAAPEARERYFDEDLAGNIRERLANDESVAGVAPLAKETVPITSRKTDLSEPWVDVLGMDASSMKGFDDLRTASGKTLALGDLEENEVYVSAEVAEGLGIRRGDKVEATLVRPPLEPQNERGPRTSQGAPPGPGTENPTVRSRNGARPPTGVGDGRPVAPTAAARFDEATREQSPPELEIAGVYEVGANPASGVSM